METKVKVKARVEAQVFSAYCLLLSVERGF
jgi:hypothetical protein